MKALLITRCGCSRMIEIDNLAMQINIPLNSGIPNAFGYSGETDIFKPLPVRSFQRTGLYNVDGVEIESFNEMS